MSCELCREHGSYKPMGPRMACGCEPIDLEACAKAAYEKYYDDEWRKIPAREQATWRAVAAAVLKAAGVKHG